MRKPLIFTFIAGAVAFAAAQARADEGLWMPSIFGDHMVLQRDAEVRVWGWDQPGQEVKVRFAGNEVSGKAGEDGKWMVKLPAMKASAKGRALMVEGSEALKFDDVLVGEVWLCSGQSNMAWSVAASDDPKLEAITARFPQIRLITVPKVGTQEPQRDFEGAWEVCSPQSVSQFSAVGYFYGRLLHLALEVPVGLIDNAWGGSAAEAWVPRSVLAEEPALKSYLNYWAGMENDLDAAVERWLADLEKWKEQAAKARAEGKTPGRRPQSPLDRMKGQHRPANLYNGQLHPLIGYGMRGVIWYQGESNSSRAAAYRKLFPRMIQQWRTDWGQGDFPFFWVQLADFMEERPQPSESAWAELREAQTMTLALPMTGQAVITDLGEASDIHPRDKQNVAKRLARHALAKVYGMEDIQAESPRYLSHTVSGNRIELRFQHTGGGMDTFDVREPIGFAIAGKDRKFVWADARIIDKERIEVWSDAVAEPVAVRYAWADNPVANVQSREGLPLTPFRTDDWPMVTAGDDS